MSHSSLPLRKKAAFQLPFTTGLPSAGHRQRVWQLSWGLAPRTQLWVKEERQSQEEEQKLSTPCSGQRLIHDSACFRSEWRKGPGHIGGIFHGTSTPSHSCAPLCLTHSAPNLQIFATSLPHNVGIFSRDSTLRPWPVAELQAKSPACFKSSPFFFGQRMSPGNSYCREYHQASF